jgi:DUF1680 family protein
MDVGVPVCASQLGAELGYHRTTIARALRQLEAAGVVERHTAGRWRCVVAPVAYATDPRKNEDSTPNRASTHAPVSIETQTVVCNSKGYAQTGQTGQQQQQQQQQQPTTAELQAEPEPPRHVAARRWYAWDRLGAHTGRRRVWLWEVADLYATEQLGADWWRSECRIGSLTT